METERLVVIDGANVATISKNEIDLNRLSQCFHYWTSKHISVLAFVPEYWRKGPCRDIIWKTHERQMMDTFITNELVALTPSQAHDDYYVIDYAMSQDDGYVVSNDMYRDHYGMDFHGTILSSEWVTKHCIDFIFIRNSFIPNAKMIHDLLHKKTSISRPSGGARAASSSSSLTTSIATDAAVQGEENNGSYKDLMFITSQTKREINLDYIRKVELPIAVLEYMYGENGKTLKHFEQFTSTKIIMPSLSILEASASDAIIPISVCGG